MHAHGLAPRIMTAAMMLAMAAAAQPERLQPLLAVIPEVVADYGSGEQVRAAEVRALLAPQVAAMLAGAQDVQEHHVRHWGLQLVNGIVNQRLLLAEARRGGIVPDPAAGRALLQQQRESLGEANFNRMLELQGTTAEALAVHLAENDAVSRWIKQDPSLRPDVSEAEMQLHYDAHPEEFPEVGAYHVAHILVAVPRDLPYEKMLKARDKVDQIHAELLRGGDFEALARAHSDCPSRAQGGDLGFLPRGRMPAQFEETVATLGPGRISDVVRSPLGYHIIRGGELQASGVKPYPAVRQELAETLRRQKQDEAVRALTERLRRQAGVRLYLTAP